MKTADIARYILTLAEQEGDPMTGSHLQRLLYFVQGFHLALLGKVAFEEPVFAGSDGPVIGSIWIVSESGKQIAFDAFDVGMFPFDMPEETRSVIEAVYTGYGQFSSWRLRQIAKNSPSWIQTRNRTWFGIPRVIPKSVMVDYFKTQITTAKQ